jgi:hypothetical protein
VGRRKGKTNKKKKNEPQQTAGGNSVYTPVYRHTHTHYVHTQGKQAGQQPLLNGPRVDGHSIPRRAVAAAAAAVMAGGRSEPVFSFFFPLCWALSSFDKGHKDISSQKKKGAGATTQLWGPLFFLPFSLLGFETSAGPIRSPKI